MGKVVMAKAKGKGRSYARQSLQTINRTTTETTTTTTVTRTRRLITVAPYTRVVNGKTQTVAGYSYTRA